MPRAQPTKPTTKRQPREIFLEKLGQGYSVTGAALAAGIDRTSVYDWRKNEPEFEAAWNKALEDGTEFLEDKARERALATSDTLMIFLLKGRKPEKYRERSSVEHSGSVAVRTKPDLSGLSVDELRALAAIQAKLQKTTL